MRAQSFRPVNRCIYCGSDGRPEGLTREHIFPFSFGGTLVLPKSSCKRCAKITSDFERECARAMFGKLRILFNLPTQHKTHRPDELPLKITVDGIEQTIVLSPSDYPAVPIMFPKFGHPGILYGLSPTEVFWGSSAFPVLPVLPDNEVRLARLRSRIGRPFTAKGL